MQGSIPASFFIFFVIFFLLAIVIGFFIGYLLKKQKKNDENKNTGLSFDLQKINENLKDFNNQLVATKVNIEKLPTNDKFESLAKDLQNISGLFLKNKAKGEFGEFQLKQILENYFGDNQEVSFWKTEYLITTKSQEKSVYADAVLFLNEKELIVIDAKFNSENFDPSFLTLKNLDGNEKYKTFVQNVANTIDKIEKIYKKADKFKVKYVLMFVPSDAIYSVISNSSKLIERGFKKKVAIVSPSLLFITLIYVSEYTKDILITKNQEKIINSLKKLFNEFLKFEENFTKTAEKIEKNVLDLENHNKKLKNIALNFNKIFELSFKNEQINHSKVIKKQENNQILLDEEKNNKNVLLT